MILKIKTDDIGKEHLSIANPMNFFKKQSLLSDGDMNALNHYNELIRGGTEPMTAFYSSMQNASDRAALLARNANGSAVDIENLAMSSQAGGLALKGLAMAGNMIAMWAISEIISIAAQKISELANASEIAAEKAEGFAASVNSSLQDSSSNTATLSELNNEYLKLSKGVNSLGENISLSADDYTRYKEIIGQISNIMPGMSAYFDAQGSKIAFTKGKLSNLNDEYQRYIQNQAKSFAAEGDEDGNTLQDVLDNYNSNSNYGFWEDAKNVLKNSVGIYDIDDLPAETMLSTFEDVLNTSKEDFAAYLRDLDFDYNGNYMMTNKNRSKAILEDVLGINSSEILAMGDEEFNALQQQITAHIQTLQAGTDADMSKINTGLVEIALGKDDFWKLDESGQNSVTTLLSSLNHKAWDALNIETENEAQVFVNKIISSISSNKDGFSDAWNGLFSLDSADIPVEEYISKVQTFMDTICNVLGITDEDDKKAFIISLGFNIDVDQAMLDGLKEKLSDAVTPSDVPNFLQEQSKETSTAWADSLNVNELKIANSDEFLDELEKQQESLKGATLSVYDYNEALQRTAELPKFSMDNIAESAQNCTNAVSGLLSSVSSLNNALIEQSENGSLSIDTMLSLVDAGYAAALQFDSDTGACTLNKDALFELLQVKLQNQLLEAEAIKSKFGEKLIQDGIDASESADGFIKLTGFKMAALTAKQSSDLDAHNNAAAQVIALQNTLSNLDKLGKNPTSHKSSASSASASDPVKDAFQKEYDALKHLRDMEQITDIDYFNEVDALNQKYYNGKTKYLTDYQKYEQEVYKGLQSAYKDLVEKQTDLLEAELDAGMIDYQTYSSTVTNLLDNMYAQGKISAANYWDFVKAKLESQLAIYDSALRGVTTLLDDEIDKWQDKIDVIEAANDKLEEQKDYYDSVLDAVSSVLENEIDLWEDKISVLEEENDGIEELVSNYDSVLSVVEKVYDKEINLINEQKNTIQEKIDAINDENSALDLQYRKSQALYELERSQQQRTKKVYGGENGYVYTTDDSAIRDAQSTLHDIETEELINSLEKEQESLQNDIDLLEEYKQKWLEVSNAYADIQNDLLARQLLGEDYETLILLNNDLDIEDFKNKYIEAQQRMDDNSDLITSYEEKVEYYEQLKEQWASIADEHEDSVNRQNAALQFGADWEQELLAGRLTAITDFSAMYSEIQAQIESNEGLIASYNEKIDYYQKLKEQWNSISEEYERQKDRQNAAMLLGSDWESSVLSGRIDTLNKFKDGYISLQQQIVDAAWNSANEQIRAAKEAEKAAAGSVGNAGNVSSNGNGSSNGNTNKSNSPSNSANSTKSDAKEKKKAAKANSNTTTKYASGGRLHYYDNSYGISVPSGEDHVSTIAWRNGERILSPSQNKNFEELTVNLPDILKSAQTLKNLIQMNPVNYAAMLDVSKYTESLCHLAKGNVSNTTLQIGDIHLHEVSDVDTFAETIVRQLPGKMLQAIHKI